MWEQLIFSQQFNSVKMSSPIIWSATFEIFSDNGRSHIIRNLSSIPHYVDDEIEGKVTFEDFSPAFTALATFRPNDYQYQLKRVPTDTGKECSMIRKWSCENSHLEFHVLDDGYVIIFGTMDTFIIVGNNNSHPFVITPKFQFYNSDGSTWSDTDYPELNLTGIILLLSLKAQEYVFHQQH
jgi:hypothetical protein